MSTYVHQKSQQTFINLKNENKINTHQDENNISRILHSNKKTGKPSCGERTKNGGETKRDPVGPSQVPKPFCVPCFSFVGKRLHPPRPSLSTKVQIQTVTN